MNLDHQYYKDNLKLSYERLQKKCEYFDNGDELIAIDIAVQIRVLIHDTQNSMSLLSHLSLKSIDFIDTTFQQWKEAGMSHCSFGDGFLNHTVIQQQYPRYAFLHRHFEQGLPIGYKPLLGVHRVNLTFEKWWSNEICILNENSSLSRKDIVLTLCNKDGAAHYDTKVNASYIRLKSKESLGVILDGQIAETQNIPLFVIIRQIAFEVLETISPIVTTL